VNKGLISFSRVFGAVFTIGLIISKLLGASDLSWLWVLAPLWIPFVIGLLIMIVGKFFVK